MCATPIFPSRRWDRSARTALHGLRSLQFARCQHHYEGSTDRIAYFYGGHLNQLIEASKEQCGNAAYKPFPELEKLCLSSQVQIGGRSALQPRDQAVE